MNQRQRSSSILKMLREPNEDRKIKKYPQAYSFTPYLSDDFSEKTKKLCLDQVTLVQSMKICKVIIIGDVCTGKTSIVNRFCHNIFNNNYKGTIGVDFEVESWDTAGQERFKCIAQSYYRRAHVVIVVFDVTNIHSLTKVQNWYQDALEGSTMDPYKFLVGTKTDIMSDASLNTVESCALKLSRKLNAEYWPVSSKTGVNIDRLFYRVAALAFDQLIQLEVEVKSPHTIGTKLLSINKPSKNVKGLSKMKEQCMKCN